MNNNIKNQIQKIINFYKIENYEKAIELALQFLKTKPESDIVLNLLGLQNLLQ